MYLIVGLGNYPQKYLKNRHNIGFMVVDHLIDHLNPSKLSKKEFKGELYKKGKLLLLKPHTYMNLSGESVKAVKEFFKIPLENLIVIHDDLDLPLGALRFKRGGGSGGHNGLKSIDESVGKEYLRVRIGISRPPNKSEVIKYVLSDFSEEELEKINSLLPKIQEAVLALTTHDLPYVQQHYTLKRAT